MTLGDNLLDTLFAYIRQLDKYRKMVDNYEVGHDEDYQSDIESNILREKQRLADQYKESIVELLESNLGVTIVGGGLDLKVIDDEWPTVRTTDHTAIQVSNNLIYVDWVEDY